MTIDHETVAMEPSGRTLQEIYNAARREVAGLDHIESGATTLQENLLSATTLLEECRSLTARLAIFSRNEDVDDISSQDLQ